MRFISSLCWVKRGCSKTPIKIKLDKDEMKEIFSSGSPYKDDEDEEAIEENLDENVENENEDGQNSDSETRKISKKYKLDDYDDEDDDLRLEKLNSLACFSTNAEDNFMEKKDDGEDSDEEDIAIKPTDNLVVCGTLDEEDSTLNVYVYNEIDNQFYIHHDILLTSTPICLEWLDFDPASEEANVNYLAVGSMNPWIEIWDLDLMDSLEPEFVLGSTNIKKKKKNKDKTIKKKKKKVMGHEDAVLSLAYNTLNRNVLASGSADKRIILWDLEELKEAIKIKNHKNRVQSLKFHPIESFSLLSGSSDKTVALFDCRNPNENKKTWKLKNDIEQVTWNHFKPNNFLCSDDEGFVYIYDIRNDKPLSSSKAHSDESAVVGLTLSSFVPNLLVTACEDEVVKIWDIENDKLDFVFEKKLKLGALNVSRASPDSNFVFSFGGTKSSEPCVWDIREIKQVRDKFYPRMNLKDDVELEEENVKIESRKQKRIDRAAKFKKIKNNNKTNIVNLKSNKKLKI